MCLPLKPPLVVLDQDGLFHVGLRSCSINSESCRLIGHDGRLEYSNLNMLNTSEHDSVLPICLMQQAMKEQIKTIQNSYL